MRWGRGDQIYDKVKDLINFDGKGSEKWCDADGKKVTLLKTANEGKVKENRITVQGMAQDWDEMGLEDLLDQYYPKNIQDPQLAVAYDKAQKACEALKAMLKPYQDQSTAGKY